MNILMCTNTYLPHVGGVARSVDRLVKELRRMGHEVWIVAPQFENTPANEHGVLRFPAVQHFNGSDFSVPVPVPGKLASLLEHFHPGIVHSHHPFLLGDLALRIAAVRNVPIVFTHHTRYELYTHYVPGDSDILKRFVIELTSGYCNLCDAVIAPSASISELLRKRNVTTPIEIIPTGLEAASFVYVSKEKAREGLKIPPDAFVVGHVGRLAPEKNLGLLTNAVMEFLLAHRSAHFLVAGDGPSKAGMLDALEAAGLGPRLHVLGVVGMSELSRVYRAMDVFVFASRTETQGMVLTEAMAARVPVVALDAAGVREVVRDGVNGRLVGTEQAPLLADALAFVAALDRGRREQLGRSAEKTARQFAAPVLARQIVDLYHALAARIVPEKNPETSAWERARRRLGEEWRIFRKFAHATRGAVLVRSDAPEDQQPVAIPSPEERRARERSEDELALRRCHSLAARSIARLFSWVLRLQKAAWHVEIEGIEAVDTALADGARVLVVFWHGKYIPLFALLSGRPACVFTSVSFRGDVIAEICRHFGFEAVQIPDEGGDRSFRLMRQVMSRRTCGAIAVDGPRGPLHTVHRGAIRLASDLGFRIFPVSVAATRKRIRAKRWDRMEIPAVISRLYAVVGDPITIPANLTEDQLAEYKTRIADALQALDLATQQRAGAAINRS